MAECESGLAWDAAMAGGGVEAVRAHCLSVAEEAYEYAGIKGLCAEGRWAYALDAMRSATLDDLAAESDS